MPRPSGFVRPIHAAWVFALLCAGLTVSNVLLLRKVAQLDTLLARTGELLAHKFGVRAGSRVPALGGDVVAGKRLDFPDGRDARKTLILVYSPKCQACAAQWPAWRDLASRVDASNVRVVAVDQTALTPPRSLDDLHLRNVDVLAIADADVVVGYDLRATPQTLLVDGAGIVEAVWTGARMGAGQRDTQAKRLALDRFPARAD